MTQVLGTPPAAPDPLSPAGPTRTQRRAARVERARRFTQNLGEVFITAGVFVLMFCAYQLWWTNVESDRATDAVVAQVRDSFVVPYVAPAQPQAEPQTLQISDGQGFGLMYIPRLGDDWVKPLVAGATLDNLKKGITHYTGTAMPGDVGNFAVAGHRATNGEPFRNLDLLRAGDQVIVETADSFFTYEITRQQIVKPKDIWVLNPIPGKGNENAVPSEALLTLTTCNPRWASYERLIVYGKMVGEIDKDSGRTPEALKGII
jgi:sortase A